MNLNELVVSQRIKLLLIGESGSGKTVFACSGPGKTYVADFDTKISSAATFYKKHKPAQLDGIEFDTFSLNKAANPYSAFKTKLTALEALTKGSAPFPYDTVVIDSLSLYAEALTHHVIVTNPKVPRTFANIPSMQDYGLILQAFKEDMNRVLSLPCNVICTAHSTLKEDVETGQTRASISLTGAIKDHLPKIFTEVYYCFAKQAQAKAPGEEPKIEHVALTRSNGKYTCRTQIPEIPLWVKLDFPTIQKYLNLTTQPKENNQ